MSAPHDPASPHERHGPGPERIKGNVKRSVYRERGMGERDQLLKLFHAPGIGGLRDRARALGEAEGMRSARAAGLPVAEVLGTTKERSGWGLRAHWIEGGTSLDSVLAQRKSRRSPLARALGELLALCQAKGFVHADPHPGNVLVDGSGTLWLVDLGRSKLGRPVASALQAFERGAASLRETDERFLVATYSAWRRSAAKRGLPPLPGPKTIDRAAQRHRLSATARRLRVWKRTSTPTAVTEEGSRPVVRVRAHEAPPSSWQIQWTDYDSQRPATRAWNGLVRARLHSLPAALPVSLALGPPWRIEFAVPPGALPTAGPPCPRLAALLEHRGLRVEGPLLRDASGSTWVGAGSTFTEEPGP